MVTRDPYRTNLKIKLDNYYCYRDNGQFNCYWFNMYLQEAIEAFLNTNELASSDQIDLYFDEFVSAFCNCFNEYALLEGASQKVQINVQTVDN